MKKFSILIGILICLCMNTVFAYSSTYYPEDVAAVSESCEDGDRVILTGQLICPDSNKSDSFVLQDETGTIQAEIDLARIRLYKVEMNTTMRFFAQYVLVGNIEKVIIQRAEAI